MRRFFRFSVRDLFWLTLVAVVGMGWLARERELQASLLKLQVKYVDARFSAARWKVEAEELAQAVNTTHAPTLDPGQSN